MAIIYMIMGSSTRLLQAPDLIDDVSGQITTGTLVPTAPGHLATKDWIDTTFAQFATRDKITLTNNSYISQADADALLAALVDKADIADLTALSDDVVHRSGATVTGPIEYGGDLLTGDQLVNKDYIDGLNDLIPANILTQAVADTRYLSMSGGTLTGPLVLTGSDPDTPLRVVSKQYVDETMPSFDTVMPLAGGTMTAPPLLLDRFPIQPHEAATKQYVDLWKFWIESPMQPYIASGSFIGFLYPFLGTKDSAGNLVSIKNAIPGHPELDMVVTGDPLVMNNGTFAKPTETSGLSFADPVSILTRRIMIVCKDDEFVGSYPVAHAWLDDGSVFDYHREMSGNRVNIGARFRFTDTDSSYYTLTTSKRGRPEQNAIYISEWFRNTGDDGMTGRIWDYNMNNTGVNGNPGIPRADGFIKLIGHESQNDGVNYLGRAFPGTIGPIMVFDLAVSDAIAAKAAAADWILNGLPALMEVVS